MFAVEKSFAQIWRELVKKGWKYKKATLLSYDQRYLPPGGDLKGVEGVDFFVGEASLLRYCRRQGWLAFDYPANATALAPAAAATGAVAPMARPEAVMTPAPHASAAATDIAEPSADAMTTPALHSSPPPTDTATTPATTTAISASPGGASSTATVPSELVVVAADDRAPPKTPASRLPRPAAKATRPAIPKPVQRPVATGKRKASASNSTPKRSRRDLTVATLPDTSESVPDTTVPAIPESQVPTTDIQESSIPERPISAVGGVSSGYNTRSDQVALDEFDSEDFLDALRRDTLFEATDPDDLNVGVDDWLLALDSEGEGDEESILLDEGDIDADEEVDGEILSSEENHLDDEHAPATEAPVEFELTDEALDRLQADEWEVFHKPASIQVLHDAAPRYDGPSGPTRAALAYASSPLAIFYFFLPKELWRKIAEESDKFRKDSIDEIAQAMRARARQRRESVPSTVVLSVDEYKAKLKRKNAIQPHEIVRFIELLVARALEPRRESLSRHWITKVEGALSRGTFGQFLSRDRFQDIARYLHFNDNEKQADSDDRAFKIRPIIQALQKTFFRGYRLGARISFDEGMVPMRHRRNPMRQFMPMKPNKWGTKFYLTCCADTAYCSRLDIYCGKANDDETAIAQRAVVKNLAQVLRGQPAQRLICTDNFYTSIPLSHKLLSMGHSHVGTIRKDRKGWCTGIEFSQKRRPKRMDRGTYRVALWKDHPEYVALTWMDNKPVRFLATGCSTQPTRVSRRERDGSVSVVPCPQLVRDYHEAMGGVDVHDQLRLQRYSIQRAIRMRKYYKAIFLGLVDLAMVNAFIVHKIAMRRRGKPVPTHAAFLRALHTDLINQTSEDFAGRDDMADLVAEPLPRVPHALEKTDEMNGAKRRQWLCKVCSAYAGAGVRSFETSYFCATCSRAKKGRVTLCNKPRRLAHGSSLTCDQVWHQSWKNGTAIPAELQHKIRFVSKRRAEVASEVDEE